MDREVFEREKHVILHGQSARFRIIKYAIIIPVLLGLYLWKGFWFALDAFVILGFCGSALHFLLRWKTDGWRKSWGPVKPFFPQE